MKNEFKGNSVEEAIQSGLDTLGISRDDAEISVVREGGVFSKAAVVVTPKEKEEVKKSAGLEYLEELMKRMNIAVKVEEKVKEDEILFFINGENANKAIGRRGDTLDAIQYLVGQYINKDKPSAEHVRVTVDADFYREKRKKTLIALARRLARDASRNHKEISLEPMNSYERRIIHFALIDNEFATTRSEGEGKDRHIVITPKNGISYEKTDFRKRGPSKTRSFGQKKKFF
ncbi:MAG TPA: RNA-binding cell elongation regulator Jag/EloR [Clostridia bacterium]|nr:RNA-binding cell elongation regulator Jag/EloR [Clostridia bacterium]